MSKKPPDAADSRSPEELRAEAEAQLALGGRKITPPEKLLFELQVHQIELEMQNEALVSAQAALWSARNRYLDLYEFSPVAYLTLTREGVIFAANLTGAAMLGVERAKLLGRTFVSFVGRDDRDLFFRKFFDAMRPEQDGRLVFKMELESVDGSVLHTEASCLRVTSADGDEQLRLGLIDNTEGHLAEAAMRTLDLRYSAVVQSAADAVISVDHRGMVVDWNSGAKRIFGYGQGEMIGRPAAVIVPTRFRKGHLDGITRAAEGEVLIAPGKVHEVVGLRKDGGEFPLELTLAGWRNETGWFCTAIMRDVSERVRLEAQLRESQKMEALGLLAGGVAHDFNNVLATIIGNVELARQDVGGAHPVLESLEEIHKASERGRRLVKQILVFGRRGVIDRKVISLGPVVEEAARLLSVSLPTGVTLKVESTADVSAVLADATHVEQAILNLCGNAFDAIRSQGRPGTVEISVDACDWEQGIECRSQEIHTYGNPKPAHCVCVTVRDDGPGMDEEMLGHLFEPFYTTKPVGEGTGLGLPVVRGIVQQHEAGISVKSKPGDGTEFRMYFPAADPRPASLAEQSGPVVSEHDAAAPVVLTQGRRILYVDDDDAIVFLMKRLLRRKGFQVTGCTEASDALAMVRADPAGFDLVVTDQAMPGMTGLQLASAIRDIRADLVVILASGCVTDELRTEAPAAGVAEIVLKPNTVDELCSAIVRFTEAGQVTAPVL